VAATVVGISRQYAGSDSPPPDVPPPANTAAAKRGPLSLVLSRKGALECTRSTVLTSKVEWTTRLTYIVPEGSLVKQGDVVARLDVSKLSQEFGEEQVDVLTAETALGTAQQDLKLQEIENRNAIAAAIVNRDNAALKRKAYEVAEFPLAVSSLKQQIAESAQNLNTAEEIARFTKRLLRKDIKTIDEFQSDLLSLARARQAHNNLVEQLRVLEEHTYPRTLAELKGNAEHLTQEVERQRGLAKTRMLSRQMQVDVQQRRLLSQQQQFEWAKKMLDQCEIRAPHDGQIVYPDLGNSWDDRVSEGMQVRFRQNLVILPDRSQMQVAVRVHESQRQHLEVGMPAVLTFDANPGRQMTGRVSEISAFPLSGRWPNHELREYEAIVQVEEPCADLVPGLTSNVDLVAAAKDDALQVPMEAVTEIGDRYVAFVNDGQSVEPREVTLGDSTTDSVEILAGLSEGERVMLTPRETCADSVIACERLRMDRRLADGTLFAE
jgi:RND family efflux transporter MFP subunit